MKNPSTQIEAWRLSDRIASHAERAIFDAAMASVDGRTLAPTEQEWQAVRNLRELANGLFHVAMQSLKDPPLCGQPEDDGPSGSWWQPHRRRAAIRAHEWF